MLRGVEFLHAMWVLHRDLKPNNLLIDRNGVLKIGDFGLAKVYASPKRDYTSTVVTLWYRSPELLFGCTQYTGAVDIWAIGCILAELLLRQPFLTAETDLGQLKTIFQVRGTPIEKDWPGVTKLSGYLKFQEMKEVPLSTYFSAASENLLELISGMLTINPLHRSTAKEALMSSFFFDEPRPSLPANLPMPAVAQEVGDGDGEENDEEKAAGARGVKRKHGQAGPSTSVQSLKTGKRLVF